MLFGLLLQMPFKLFEFVLIAIGDGQVQIDIALNVWIGESSSEL